MSIMNAPPYDPARDRRRKLVIAGIVVSVLVIAFLAWEYRYWTQERVADHFFTALQHKDYEQAYGVWLADADWKQHAQKYPKYPFGEFYTDWGPGGEWGAVQSYKLRASGECKGGSSGVVVEVIVNDRAEPARVWVEKRDKTMSYPPC
jgi:hypothetical protein